MIAYQQKSTNFLMPDSRFRFLQLLGTHTAWIIKSDFA